MELSAKNIEVAVVSSAFCDWDALLMLLRASFAYQHGRIDPPSSLCALASADLAAKATVETLFLATEADALIGCLFAKRMANTLYLNKFAVLPQRQQCGIGKRLSNVAEQHARSLGLDALTLNTRIELPRHLRSAGLREASRACPQRLRPPDLHLDAQGTASASRLTERAAQLARDALTSPAPAL